MLSTGVSFFLLSPLMGEVLTGCSGPSAETDRPPVESGCERQTWEQMCDVLVQDAPCTDTDCISVRCTIATPTYRCTEVPILTVSQSGLEGWLSECEAHGGSFADYSPICDGDTGRWVYCDPAYCE